MVGVGTCDRGKGFGMRESYHGVQEIAAKTKAWSQTAGKRRVVDNVSPVRRRASVEHGHGDLGQNKPVFCTV